MNHESGENIIQREATFNTFRQASKIILYVPLVIIVLIVLAKLSNPDAPVQRLQVISPSPFPTAKVKYGTNSAEVSQKPSFQIASNSATFDLKGPYKCTYTDEKMDVTAYIKNRQIYAEISSQGTPQRAVIKGDCLYSWNMGETTGKKMCGVTQYLQLFDTVSQMGLMNSETILKYMAQKGSGETPAMPIQQQAKMCTKVEIEDSLFTIPTITFSEESAQQMMQKQ